MDPDILSRAMSDTSKKVECVGSLIVSQSDMKELSEASPKKVDEAVGTLFVHSTDLQELSQESPTTPTGATLDGASSQTSPPANNTSSSLVRRLTERVSEALNKLDNGEYDEDEDPSRWLD